jgi:hypothetical protein
MTISALIVAAIGLSIIAVLSTNNSNVSAENINNNYLEIVREEIQDDVDISSRKERKKLRYNVDSISNYNIELSYRESLSPTCFNVIYRTGRHSHEYKCIR